MEPEVMAGWIGGLAGLAGAVVGAGGALLGGWLQHRQQQQTAAVERREGYARAAEENVLNHLLQLHRSLHDALRRWDVRGDNSEWRSGQSEHLREIEMTSHLLPGEELRSRLKEVITAIYADGSGHDELTKVAKMVGISQEGIDLLAAQLRGEPLPPRSAAFIAWRDGS